MFSDASDSRGTLPVVFMSAILPAIAAHSSLSKGCVLRLCDVEVKYGAQARLSALGRRL